MCDGRDYLHRVWQLAEDLAVHAGKPLHAFLLLHYLLTRPPAQLRSVGTAVKASAASSSSSTAAATPLHQPSLDAEWRCEELATRVRAGEYLLLSDVTPPVCDASPAVAMAPPHSEGATSPMPFAAPPTSRTLSRAAALESLELAEEVLAPVFAAASQTAGQAPLDAVLCEVAQTSTTSTNNSLAPQMSSFSTSSYYYYRSTSSEWGGDGFGAGVFRAADARAGSPYFFNESTVTALAWPLTSFTLTWPFASASPPLLFKAASQTIMIPAALVVRAHVLQAVVCYRRVQHKRALQCLAEARRWVARQFTEAAQTRSLRLLWADLQERWSPAVSTSANDSSVTAVPRLSPQYLPRFDRMMRQLMKREQRVCTTMISVEECKVHFAILQACGTLPPPPLLLRPVSDASKESTAGQTPAHAPDLRLHYKRYQESAQLLQHVSRVYMRVLDWIEEEESGKEENAGSENEATHEAEDGENGNRRVRVKREDSGDVHQGKDEVPHEPLQRDEVRLAQSQLSPFCLCALRRSGSGNNNSTSSCCTSSSLFPDRHSTEVQKQDADDHSVKTERKGSADCEQRSSPCDDAHAAAVEAETSAGTASAQPHSVTYTVNYDMRLAAAVLGWYHCASFFYVLHQQASPATPSTEVKSKAEQDVGVTDAAEARFLARYSCVSASTSTIAHRSKAALHDPVQRALAHFHVYAFVFGAFPASVASPSEKSMAARWRCGSAGANTTTSSSASSLPQLTLLHCSPAHEAVLLLCLAELALMDCYPFALNFSNAAKEGGSTSAPRAPPRQSSLRNSKLSSFEPKEEDAAEEEKKAEDAVKAEPEDDESTMEGPTVLAPRKRRRSPTLLHDPPSWHWVLPGVRATLQLYLQLTTVLMQAATTIQVSTPPTSPMQSATRGAATAAASAAVSLIPPVPILQAGLQRAEQVLARLLFTLDREMLQLTGNMWSMAAAAVPSLSSSFSFSVPSSASGVSNSRAGGLTTQQHSSHSRGADSKPSLLHTTPAPVDYFQSSSPAQLRWLVQIKTAALLTMARHHLTQLSIVRAVHYLREVQHFTRVFHRQAKLSLLPEMHVLLAAVAACLSLRRLPDHHSPLPQLQLQHRRHRGMKANRSGVSVLSETDYDNDDRWTCHDSARGRGGTRASGAPPTEAATASMVQEALYNFAQGWPSIDAPHSSAASGPTMLRTSLTSSVEGGSPPASSATAGFSILPQEEATVAQDVGLPYLHLLAAEHAACTSLHTPPSFILLLHLMKAWAVYQLVAAGEELRWVATAPLAAEGHTAQQQQQGKVVAVHPPSPPLLPLPTASYATTTLNSTIEDQQRRVARLDSLTTTPTSTPTLRSRHAALPAEMQRIQLDSTAVTSPLLSPARPPDAAAPSEHSITFEAPPPSSPRAPPTTPTAQAVTVPLTVRHRAGDVLQRMMAVLRHHYDVYAAYEASVSRPPSSSSPAPSTSTATAAAPDPDLASPPLVAVPTTAWTPLNVILFRLLRGAVLLTEDRDEPAAARELKETTHYAKTKLGVLHPYVADGLALLTSAYAALDVETTTSSLTEGGGDGGPSLSDSPQSPQQQQRSDSASRARRVAVQLAMRCSCNALAALAASEHSFQHLTKSTVPSPAVSAGNTADGGAASTDGVNGSPQQQQATTGMLARLRDWWATQVLEELCGNGNEQRSAHAVKRLQALFSWLPGAAEGQAC